ATIDPNVGIVPVPDERVDKLANLSKSKKKIPAVVEFYDIAGLVKGASTGEGLGNQFLSHIRETQAIVTVLRVFKNSEIIHVENSVDPERDLAIINTELIIKDLETVEKRIGSLEKESRAGDKFAPQALQGLLEIKKRLLADQLPVSHPDLISLIRTNKRIDELNLLTAKKQLYLLNGDESEVGESLKQKIKTLGGDFIVMNLVVDENTGNENLPRTEGETASTLAEGQISPSGIGELIKKSYEILNLISFLTTGEDETRAWTIKKGAKAPEAAGVIHTDFEKKFIRAEVVNWQKLLDSSSWSKAREKGLLRLEGKEYVVQDGDVIVVRHG
ncbi:MAG: redox-regulated ATPase YchF, partial [Candidatus Liptonbacteria bacterium]|nr:redox-regulated ATPase YchF [Candidatus Liptonbacteria bacterium]